MADGRPILVVLPASSRVDLAAMRSLAGAREVRLATEQEFSGLYPECETGAMAPLGPLYNQPVYVDDSLAEDPEIVFQAGTHVDAIRIRFVDFVKPVHPVPGRLALQPAHERGY